MNKDTIFGLKIVLVFALVAAITRAYLDYRESKS